MATRTQIETFERTIREARKYLAGCIDNSKDREQQYWKAGQLFFMEFEQCVSNAKQLAILEPGYGN